MTEVPTTNRTQSPGSGKMILVMGGVGLIASVLLVGTFRVTSPYIEENRRIFLENAIYDVVPGAASMIPLTVDGDVVETAVDIKSASLFAGFDETGRLAGLAIEASGQGYQDVVSILFGYAPDCRCVVGMRVLDSKETPGLGDKIEKDPAFLENFEALDVTLSADRMRLANEIEMVKPGSKTERWQIEAITGATVSSRAVTRMIARQAAEMIPVVERNLDRVREMR